MGLKVSLVLLTIFVIFLTTDSVQIGISKQPAPIPDNVTTVSEQSQTTQKPATTTVSSSTTTSSTTSSTTPKKVEATKPTTTTVTKASPTTPKTTSTTTTTQLPIYTKAPSVSETQNLPIRNENLDHSGYFCKCDIRHNLCDINCCCDIDCLKEEIKSFECLREKNYLDDAHYQQGLPPCKVNEGWLCVFRTNFDDTKRKVINDVVDFAEFLSWPTLLLEADDLTNNKNFFKIGEPILLYNIDSSEITEYDLPYSFAGHHCQIFESVRHLTSQKTSCHITWEKAQQLEATLSQKLGTSLLLQRPNIRLPIDGIIKETQTEFISITLFRCTSALDCFPVSISNTTLDIFDDSSYSSLIQTKIYHNITNLISCDVLFFRSSDKEDKIWQNYDIDFIHINETNGHLPKASGPLGYNSGSPLIIGYKVLLNETAEHIASNLVLNYFHPNRTESIHIYIPRRSQGLCEKSQSTLNFGESVLATCMVQLDNSTELTSETNFTRLCDDLQKRSLEFLQGNDFLKLQEEYFISVLGYPKNKSDLWTQIEVRNYEQLPVVGVYLDKEFSFICQNMILGLKYEFLTVSQDWNGVSHQNIVKRAALEVGTRLDLKFQLDEAISFPITFSAVFQDQREISGSKTISQDMWCVLISFLVFISFQFNIPL